MEEDPLQPIFWYKLDEKDYNLAERNKNLASISIHSLDDRHIYIVKGLDIILVSILSVHFGFILEEGLKGRH